MFIHIIEKNVLGSIQLSWRGRRKEKYGGPTKNSKGGRGHAKIGLPKKAEGVTKEHNTLHSK